MPILTTCLLSKTHMMERTDFCKLFWCPPPTAPSPFIGLSPLLHPTKVRLDPYLSFVFWDIVSLYSLGYPELPLQTRLALNSLVPASVSARIKGMSYHAWLLTYLTHGEWMKKCARKQRHSYSLEENSWQWVRNHLFSLTVATLGTEFPFVSYTHHCWGLYWGLLLSPCRIVSTGAVLPRHWH